VTSVRFALSGCLDGSVTCETPEMIHRRDAEVAENRIDVVSQTIIGAAVEVHRSLGPGLLESSYQRCLAYELASRGVRLDREVEIPIRYKGLVLRPGYRIDMLVEGAVVVEVKTVAAIEPIHKAQILTYLKLMDLRVGLLINFNVARLLDGLRRVVNRY
jgi:GxxExxY protein